MASIAWSLLMLLAVLALIPLALWGVKQLQSVRAPGAPRMLEIAAQLPLGARERVVALRVNDRLLLLGVTPQQVTLLGDAGEAPAAAAEPTAFARVLRNLGERP